MLRSPAPPTSPRATVSDAQGQAEARPNPPRRYGNAWPAAADHLYTNSSRLNEPPPLQEYSSTYGADDDATAAGPVPVPTTRPSHRRNQSIPNLLPLAISNSFARSPSPDKNRARFSVDMPFTGDRKSAGQNSPQSAISRWWNSPSSTPTTEGPNPYGGSAGSDNTPTRLRSNAASADSSGKDDSAGSSRFAFLASSMSALSRLTQNSVTPASEEEMLSLDVEAALFPSGSPSDRDAFSPAAFKNLQTNAAGMLLKMQSAYRQQAIELRELREETSAQKEEYEEADIRAKHLKMQLEDMARKAAAQERAMRHLMEDLAAERRARQEERIQNAKSPMGEGSMVSEDLGVEDEQRRRMWRKSGGTMKSDGSFDTDEESIDDESVFSRSRSPTTMTPNAYEGGFPEGPSSSPKVVVMGPPRQRNPQRHSQPQMSTFQKLIKGIAGDREEDETGSRGCSNCRGQNASAAWNTVGLLRDENRGLKQRVGQLEHAVEGALDVVQGIGL